MSDNPKLLPPKLADWTEGHAQIGIFVRTRMGSVIEYVNDNLDTPGARKEIRGMLAPFLDEGWSEIAKEEIEKIDARQVSKKSAKESAKKPIKLNCQECGKPAFASYWHPDGKTLEAMLCRKHEKVFRAESAQQVSRLREMGYPAPNAANPKAKPRKVGSDERHRQGER